MTSVLVEVIASKKKLNSHTNQLVTTSNQVMMKIPFLKKVAVHFFYL